VGVRHGLNSRRRWTVIAVGCVLAATVTGPPIDAATSKKTTKARTTKTKTTKATNTTRAAGKTATTAVATQAAPGPGAGAGGGGAAARAMEDRYVWWRGVNLAGADFGMANGSEPPGTTTDPRLGVIDRDYQFPSADDIDYLAAKRMNLVRLPIGWERVQPDLFGPLDQAYLGQITTVVQWARAKKQTVIIDVHNYARYTLRGGTTPTLVGTKEVPTSALADLWKRLAAVWPDAPDVILGIMNEPHSMSSEVWLTTANETIAAIRSTGAGNLILVPGNNWSGGFSWFESWFGNPSNAEVMSRIVDPFDWWMYDIHQYIDENSSGGSETCVSRTTGSERLARITTWLRQQRRPAMLTEFNVGRNDLCYAALDDWMRFIEANGDVWKGWAYWAGGRAWNDSLNTIEPVRRADGSWIERPQMAVLVKYIP
jgi:endoglucanase